MSSPGPVVPRGKARGISVESMSRTLEDEILAGRLGPGVRLEEPALAARFGTSRTPVREALRQLIAIGLVSKLPNKGVVVTPLDQRRTVEMFEAMAELEAMAARLSAERMSEVARQRLQKVLDRSRGCLQAQNHAGYEALNTTFHSAIYKGSGNEVIAELVAGMRRRVAPFRRAQFSMTGRLEKSFVEHSAVLDAILRRDGAGAAEAMRVHLETVRETSIAFLEGGHRAPNSLKVAG